MSIIICPKCGEEYDSDFKEFCPCEENSYERLAFLEDLALEEQREAFEEEDEILSELANRNKDSSMVGFGGEML